MIKLILFTSLFFVSNDINCSNAILKYENLLIDYNTICIDIDKNSIKYCKNILEKIVKLEDYLIKECNYDYTKNC